jgi:hypothetical protein
MYARELPFVLAIVEDWKHTCTVRRSSVGSLLAGITFVLSVFIVVQLQDLLLSIVCTVEM